MRTHKMLQAESMRYAKIQRQIDLLCGKEKTILDDMAKDGMMLKRTDCNDSVK